MLFHQRSLLNTRISCEGHGEAEWPEAAWASSAASGCSAAPAQDAAHPPAFGMPRSLQIRATTGSTISL